LSRSSLDRQSREWQQERLCACRRSTSVMLSNSAENESSSRRLSRMRGDPCFDSICANLCRLWQSRFTK
jgi:hypothetical protein